MSWGGESVRRKATTQPTFAPPRADNLPPPPKKKPYSYLQQSPGYTKCVTDQTRNALKQFGAVLADMFVVSPTTEAQRKAITYFAELGVNEQRALREVYESQKYSFDVC